MRSLFMWRAPLLRAWTAKSPCVPKLACPGPRTGNTVLHPPCVAAGAAGHNGWQAAQPCTREPNSEHTHEYFMSLALEEASKAVALGEVPVGAVLVSEFGEVLAAAHNQVEALGDPTAHAELACLRAGAAALGGWRLLGATLYVTLEPCPMCAGALLQARVAGLVYGARNRLLGADGSWIAMLPRAPAQHDGGGGGSRECGCIGGGGSGGAGGRGSCASTAAAQAVEVPAPPVPRHPFHSTLTVTRGVLEAECSQLMRAFFRARRQQTGNSSDGGGSSDESSI